MKYKSGKNSGPTHGAVLYSVLHGCTNPLRGSLSGPQAPTPSRYSRGVCYVFFDITAGNSSLCTTELYVVNKICCLTHLQPSKDRWLLIGVGMSVWLAVCKIMNELINCHITRTPGTVNIIDCLAWLPTPRFHRRPCDPATPYPKFFSHTATPSCSLRIQEWAWYHCDTNDVLRAPNTRSQAMATECVFSVHWLFARYRQDNGVQRESMGVWQCLLTMCMKWLI